MAKLQNVTRAHLGLLLANLVWAVNYPFYKVLMPHYITPVALATFAVTVAGLLRILTGIPFSAPTAAGAPVKKIPSIYIRQQFL